MKKLVVTFLLTIFLSTAYATVDLDAINADKQIKVTVLAPERLVTNEANEVILKLEDRVSGNPITPDDLKLEHTEKVHLLIIDPTLTDYHHQHPKPNGNPGEYAFKFTPKTTNNYRIWADLVPVNGTQEYVIVDLIGSDNCAKECYKPKLNREAKADGFEYQLSFMPDVLEKGKDGHGKLIVKDKEGQPVKNMEFLMGEFAHFVGFYDDFVHIAHLHPMGPTPESEASLGGPEIAFHIKPDRAGHMQLFSQIKVDGKERFAGFGLVINESSDN